MKTSTLAFVYGFSGGVMYFVSRFLYLNEFVPDWFEVWYVSMLFISVFMLGLLFIVHRKPTRGTERRVSGGTPPTRTPARGR